MGVKGFWYAIPAAELLVLQICTVLFSIPSHLDHFIVSQSLPNCLKFRAYRSLFLIP